MLIKIYLQTCQHFCHNGNEWFSLDACRQTGSCAFLGTGPSILGLLTPGPIWVRHIDKAAATSHLVIQSHTPQLKFVSSIVIFCTSRRFIKLTGQSPFLVAALDLDWTYTVSSKLSVHSLAGKDEAVAKEPFCHLEASGQSKGCSSEKR